ncbi:MAG: helix-turn-helix domain-containing protein [Lachnospiraceae bacterium]|nr:helix-turn-helix domain-containing protein [Lachnospiraceae bacterium]
MEIGERLYHWRNHKNMSVYKLSRLSGVSENHIRNIENGNKQPTYKILQAITDGLNITLSEFFNTDDGHVSYLSDGERRILEYYRRMPKDKADILIEFYERMCQDD